MTRESYQKLTGYLRDKPKRIQMITGINSLLTGMVFFLYPCFICMLFLQKDDFVIRAVFVPGISFILVSLFRKIVNVPRPYERFGIPPILKKDSSGKSFPSRHVFSIFVIAVTIFVSYPAVGIVLAVAGIALAVIRVIGGVHEPRDVAAGAVVGILAGVIGYYLIP